MVGPGKPKPGPMVRACVADDCYTDSDCERGKLCFCGTGASGSNECGESECHDDADCAGRECAEESFPPMPPSSLPPPRHTPHYCRTAADQCKTASNCREGVACMFNKDWRRFECAAAAVR
jgi:hypothetical protein